MRAATVNHVWLAATRDPTIWARLLLPLKRAGEQLSRSGRRISVSEVEIYQREVSVLRQPRCKHVTRLDLSGCELGPHASILEVIKEHVPNLTELDMRRSYGQSCWHSDAYVERKVSRLFPTLKRLSLSSTNPKGLIAINGCCDLTFLACSWPHKMLNLDVLQGLSNLEVLAVSGSVASQSVSRLVSRCPHLTHVFLSAASATQVDVDTGSSLPPLPAHWGVVNPASLLPLSLPLPMLPSGDTWVCVSVYPRNCG